MRISGMRHAWYLTAALLFPALPSSVHAEIAGTCVKPPAIDLPSGAALDIASRSGEIEIVGSSAQAVSLHCEIKKPEDLQKVKISFSGSGSTYKLRVEGGPTNNANFHLRLEVPTRTNLKVRASAGEVKVADVDGNKDIRLTAGEIHLSAITPEKYGHVSAAATIGEVALPAGFANKKLFFASFVPSATPQKYEVRAHVDFGEVHFE